MNDFLSWVVGTSKPCEWSPTTPVKRTIFSLGLMGNINLRERKACRLYVSLVISILFSQRKHWKVQKTKQNQKTDKWHQYPLSLLIWASLIAQLVKNSPARQETWVPSLAGKIPWRRERLPTPVFCPRELHGLYRPWGYKELDTTEWLSLPLLI